MVQFYFLSVLLNLLAGLILVYGKSEDLLEEETAETKKFQKLQDAVSEEWLFGNEKFCFVVAVLSVVVGFLKLFVVFGSGIAVIGDLLPVVAGILGGGAILIQYFRERSETLEIPPVIEDFLDTNKFYIGIGCLVVAVLHFIVPGAVIL